MYALMHNIFDRQQREPIVMIVVPLTTAQSKAQAEGRL
jgi:hypothetical protein